MTAQEICDLVGLELNAVAQVVMVLRDNPSKENIENSIHQLELYCEYVREHQDAPILWHEFLARKERARHVS